MFLSSLVKLLYIIIYDGLMFSSKKKKFCVILILVRVVFFRLYIVDFSFFRFKVDSV